MRLRRYYKARESSRSIIQLRQGFHSLSLSSLLYYRSFPRSCVKYMYSSVANSTLFAYDGSNFRENNLSTYLPLICHVHHQPLSSTGHISGQIRNHSFGGQDTRTFHSLANECFLAISPDRKTVGQPLIQSRPGKIYFADPLDRIFLIHTE